MQKKKKEESYEIMQTIKIFRGRSGSDLPKFTFLVEFPIGLHVIL